MKPAILMVVATICLLSTNAIADDFTFSFSDATGTVTGEIFGLQNNTISPATKVLITSYPASLGNILDLDATQWAGQLANAFQEVNGTITAASFVAFDSVEPLPELVLGAPGQPAILETITNQVRGPVTFITAPVPEPSAWILFLTVMLAVAIVKRSRRTDGLNDPATRMRS